MTVQKYVFKPVRVTSFTQATPSDTWVITYPFTGIPVVDIMVEIDGGALQKIMPEKVEQTAASTITVTFTQPYAGQARITA